MRAVALALLVVAGCDYGSKVDVVNSTGQPLTELRVEVAGATFEAKDVPAGDRKTWRFSPDRDGCLRVTARTADGQAIASECVGYTTPNERASHRLVVEADRVAYDVTYR